MAENVEELVSNWQNWSLIDSMNEKWGKTGWKLVEIGPELVKNGRRTNQIKYGYL